MKQVAFLFIILTLIIPLSIASADDPAIGSAGDNACNTGGSMAGQCTSEWHWTCGYYLARLEAKTLSRTLFPAQCASLVTGTPLASIDSPIGPFCIVLFDIALVCVNGNQYAFDYFPLDGINDGFAYLGNCPPGTSVKGTLGEGDPEIRALLNANGYPDSTLLCQ